MNQFKFRHLSILVILFLSCNTPADRWKIDLKKIGGEPVTITIHRYEQDLFSIDPNNLKEGLKDIHSEYEVFLGLNYKDTLQLLQMYNYLTDPLLIGLYENVVSVYPDLKFIEEELSECLTYLDYYYPETALPDIYTYISGLDFSSPVIYNKDVLIIALDLYLGQDFEPYKETGVPLYRINRCSKEYILRDCMYELAQAKISDSNTGTSLLDFMVHEGKKMYFLDMVMPFYDEGIKIGFTAEQLDWCQKNESNIWKFIIENNYLYSGDVEVVNRFLSDGPFTKGFPGSPSRLGVWVGWQIVRKYMNRHPDISFDDLIQHNDAQEILTNSRYKPRL